jgi:hypothetical protein
LSKPLLFLKRGDDGMSDRITILNELLEAERAGVKTISHLLDEFPADELEGKFKLVKLDEAWSCAGLHDAIVREGGSPSNQTGAFVDKVLALNTLVEKLTLLNKGQAWVARKINELLSLEIHNDTREFLIEMRQKHIDNIRDMEKYLSGRLI